jgi:branched-chain amino acid transport system substrate-binding protein
MTIPETWGHSIADTDFIGQKMKEELGIKKLRIALVLDKAKYTEDWGDFAEDVFKKMGYEVVGVWKANYAATDLYAEANAIKAKNAHLIYIIMAGPGGAAFVNAWGKLKMPAVLCGTVTESQRLAFWESSGGAASYLASYDSIGRVKMSERTLPFYDKYLKKFGDKPGWMSPFTEGALLALKEAVERAGTLDTDAVIKELEKTDLVASNGRLKFHGMDHKWPHQAIRELRTMVSFQWRDGEMIVYFPNATKLNPALLKKVPTLAILEKTKYEGTGELELPPWVVEYWKSKRE